MQNSSQEFKTGRPKKGGITTSNTSDTGLSANGGSLLVVINNMSEYGNKLNS